MALDGELTTDPAALDAAADDFGHSTKVRPQAVLRPGSTADIATVLHAAARQGIPVAARGRGHSSAGQALTSGIVVEMDRLAVVHEVAGDRITVDAGTTWHTVLMSALAHGRTPPVLTDYLGVTVGGTLSVGGIGGASHRYGVQTDTVLELEVITGAGRTVTCSPAVKPDLFWAVLAGYGQCAIIIRATLRLIPAPTMVRRYLLRYPTATARAADQRLLLATDRFEHLQGQIVAGDNGWTHLLEAGAHYSPPAEPDDDALLAGLAFDGSEVTDLTYLEFADRLAPTEAYLRKTGEWHYPHPWWNAFLPDTTIDAFTDRLVARLTPAGLGASGLVLTYPIRTAALTTPLFRVPAEPTVFLVSLLRFAPLAELENLLVDNEYWYDVAAEHGGVAYPIGTVRCDWPTHFGPGWADLARARQRHDPHGILTPGPGIFPTSGREPSHD
jgi:cytokinin dehydrogenase